MLFKFLLDPSSTSINHKFPNSRLRFTIWPEHIVNQPGITVRKTSKYTRLGFSFSRNLFTHPLRKNLRQHFRKISRPWNMAGFRWCATERLFRDTWGQAGSRTARTWRCCQCCRAQLICLARVLPQWSKIVVLDEPTAHVDPDTKQTIWNVVRDKLKESTFISIAHRWTR